jgi:hypothetical protein
MHAPSKTQPAALSRNTSTEVHSVQVHLAVVPPAPQESQTVKTDKTCHMQSLFSMLCGRHAARTSESVLR